MQKLIKYLHIVFSVMIGIVAVLLVKNQFSPLLLRNAHYGMPALIEKGEVDNLYLGSSMFRQGLDINEIKKNNGNSYILAYNGNQPVLECEELKYLLSNGVKIRRLYVDMYVYSAWSRPSLQDEKILLELDIKGKSDLLSRLRDGELSLSKIWRMFITGNNELILSWPMISRLVDSQFMDGGTLVYTKGMNKTEMEESKAPRISGDMDEIQRKAIEEIAAITDKSNIELIFVETPKCINTINDEGYIEAMSDYAKLLDQLNIRYILSSNTGDSIDNDLNIYKIYDFDCYDSDLFMDNVHLSYSGREEFTKKLVECQKE